MTKTMDPAGMDPSELDKLLADPKAVFEYRILRATRRLLARRGLTISVDDIAEEADVGRRTVFRYFESRDDLVARALNDSLDQFYASVSESSAVEMPFQPWLTNIVTALLKTQLSAGVGLWQLAASDDKDLPTPIAKVNKKRRASRKASTAQIANSAWQRAGGVGDAPRDVELAFAQAISSFTVQSMNNDYGAGFEETTDLLSDLLFAFLTERVRR